jgi:hypothetical protein
MVRQKRGFSFAEFAGMALPSSISRYLCLPCIVACVTACQTLAEDEDATDQADQSALAASARGVRLERCATPDLGPAQAAAVEARVRSSGGGK